MFGPHLLLDGSRCNAQKLGDRLLLERLLSDYPAAIGMTKIGGPYMFEYQAPDPAYSGVSGIVVIAESHIAIHTFPALDYFTMDIFSCKHFDHEVAIQYIQDALEVGAMDRMLVQRGLGFRGPHHGAAGATDELIAAAEARLASGITSTETVSAADLTALRSARAANHADHADHAERRDPAGEPTAAKTAVPSAGRMIWPEYGVTPDVGTYGARAKQSRDLSLPVGDAAGAAPGGASAPEATPSGVATEPVQLNPTASISGLLDKLGGAGLGGRAASRALEQWEQLARDPDCAIVLAVSRPLIAEGLRELLAATVERRFVDVVLATGSDLFADLYESLGYVHYAADGTASAVPEDSARVAAFLAEFVAGLAESRDTANALLSGSDLLRALGEALSERAPRKGLIQAAAAAGLPLFAPDLAASEFGAALLAARACGAAVGFDALADLSGLSAHLAQYLRVGTVAVGGGVADAFLARALALAGDAAPFIAGAVHLGGGLATANPHRAITCADDPTLLLPLLVSGLAQRVPSTRGLRARREQGSADAKSRPVMDADARALV